jgi:hypothetical protein
MSPDDNQGRGWDELAEQRIVDQLIVIFVVGVILAACLMTIWEKL